MRLRCLLVALPVCPLLFAQEYTLSKDGIGPISLKLQAGKGKNITATCRNGYAQPIRSAKFCLRKGWPGQSPESFAKSACDWSFQTVTGCRPAKMCPGTSQGSRWAQATTTSRFLLSKESLI